MRPAQWLLAKKEDLQLIKGICLDIDETLSTNGKLTAAAFQALWALKQSGFAVVPITGRPAGWCDHIARFWPVDAVVGENGAFTFFVQDAVRRRLNTPSVFNQGSAQKKLKKLSQKILEQFPHAKWASDQKYREADLAIDICEDVKSWPKKDINALLELCCAEGAHAKLSSIHVNTWFGDYDKCRGFKHWLAQGAPGLKGKAPSWDQWLFVGDSPNDEPMFANFKYSVGVANLKKYLKQLKNPPTWITQKKSGAGFVEVCQKVVLGSL